MSTASKFAALAAWTVLIGVGSFGAGVAITHKACQAKDVKSERKDKQLLARKNSQARAVGIKIEQAQDHTDQIYQQIKADYERDQQQNPGIGCVLDPVSLRRWNAANAQSDSAAGSEPDDEMPEATETATGPERGEQPH